MSDKEFKSKPKESKQMNIFSKEKINLGRQNEVDYLKTFGIFLMITTHIYDSYSPGYEIIYFLSFISGAAEYMFLMGISTQYSRHHAPKNYLIRGFRLITIGQLVYLLRNTLPNLIAWWIKGDQILFQEHY